MAEPMRELERLRSPREIAPTQADFPDLLCAGARLRGSAERLERRLRSQRLLFGLVERTVQTHDLRALNRADPREPGDRLTLAPRPRGFRPFAGAPIVREAPADADRDAIDVAGDVRRDVAPERRQRALIHHRQALLHLRLEDEAGALEHECERLEVAVGEATTDLLPGGGVLRRFLEPASLDGSPEQGEFEPPLFRAAVERGRFEEAAQHAATGQEIVIASPSATSRRSHSCSKAPA